MIPSMFLAILNYGVYGAGITWLIVNFFWFLLWPYFIHKKFFQNVYAVWLKKIITTSLYILFLNIILSLIGHGILNGSNNRMTNFTYLFILGLVNLFFILIISKKLREFILIKFRVLKL